MFREEKRGLLGVLVQSDVGALGNTDLGLAPWENEPQRLWSLESMLRHYAGNWLAVTTNLVRLRWLHTMAITNDAAAQELDKHEVHMLQELGCEVEQMPFSIALKKQVARVTENIRGEKYGPHHPVSLVLIDEMIFNMQAEMESHLFLCVSDRYKAIYESGRQAFGTEVTAAFPKAGADIAEAVRCLAVDRWTASVFHSMRILQQGLIALAERIGVQPEDTKRENWKNIIDQIEKRIREIEVMPKSCPLKAETLRGASAAAAQFRYFKDAWRNHVVHGDDVYDEAEAEMVLSHVQEFMRSLSAVVSTAP